MTKRYTGQGQWTSAPVRFGCSGPLTVTYVFQENSTGGTPDAFAAEVDDSNGALVGSIDKQVAAAGGKTTTLYPASPEVPPFHLTVGATGLWSFTFRCKALT